MSTFPNAHLLGRGRDEWVSSHVRRGCQFSLPQVTPGLLQTFFQQTTLKRANVPDGQPAWPLITGDALLGAFF